MGKESEQSQLPQQEDTIVSNQDHKKIDEYPAFNRQTDDPEQPLTTASDLQKTAHGIAIKEYTREMLETYHITKNER